MDEYCCCHHGNILPALKSHDQSHDDLKENEEEEDKDSDAEIMQRDMVEVCHTYTPTPPPNTHTHSHTYTHTFTHNTSSQGYLQVKLLHRLRYILEVCRPMSTTTVLILEVLTRICRHSMSAASKVSLMMSQI